MNKDPHVRAFASLSLRDLLEAREAYHVHLTNLENVVATAVGRYLIRHDDWFATHPPDEPRPEDDKKPTGPKTLFNTVVRPWSWPCVLVFVRDWIRIGEFGAHPERAVPRALYLPDGRVIPTCVIHVEVTKPSEERSRRYFPRTVLGGGYLVSSDVQGKEHIGTLGCLVTDGRTTFALSNRHVIGAPGQEVFSYLGGKRVRIGESHSLQLSKKAFSEVYPGWPGQRSVSNLDAGLIRVDDVNDWTCQVFGVGELGPMVDIHANNLTVDLIDEKLSAFGGASGKMSGRIRGALLPVQVPRRHRLHGGRSRRAGRQQQHSPRRLRHALVPREGCIGPASAG